MLKLFVALLMCGLSHACMVSRDYPMMNTIQLMDKFDILVYGEYLNTTVMNWRTHHTEGEFRVECILRNDDPESIIPPVITIQNPISASSCDETRIQRGHRYLAGLQRRNGQFHVHRFMLQNSAVRANKRNMARAAGLCSVSEIKMPEGTSLVQSSGCLMMHSTFASLRSNDICANVVPSRRFPGGNLQREASPAAVLPDNHEFYDIYARHQVRPMSTGLRITMDTDREASVRRRTFIEP